MALHLQTFKTRTLTAVVFAVIMLGGLLWNEWSFIILFLSIHFGCWYEYIKLLRKINPKRFRYYLPLGLFYITLPVFLMIDLLIASCNYDLPPVSCPPIIPCGIIFSLWINDTMAYIVGSFIGKTSFSKISPKKTWEGTIGGAVLCVIVIGLLGYYIPVAKKIDVKYWVSIATIVTIFGTLGDLLESKLKRLANVKDSGTLMPGHGGFLDRFDSFLVATPFVWLFVYLFMR